MFKYKYEVNLYEYRTGAESPIDIVETDDEVFTADDYIAGCECFADEEYIDMLRDNEVRIYRVED